MPRLILLNQQPSGWASLATGAAEGLGQGILQQEQARRQMEARRQIMADQLGGQMAVQGLKNQYEQGKETRQNSAALERIKVQNDLLSKRESTNYDRSRADKLTDEQTKQARDDAEGQAYLRASGVGQPGEDFYLNPNSQPVVPQMGRQAAESFVTNKRMAEHAAAAQAGRAVDDARQDKALAGSEAGRAETIRHNKAMEGREMTNTDSLVKTRESQAAAADAERAAKLSEPRAAQWDKESAMLRSLLVDWYSGGEKQAQLKKDGWTPLEIRKQISIAESSAQSIRDETRKAGGNKSAPVSTGDPVDDELARRGLK